MDKEFIEDFNNGVYDNMEITESDKEFFRILRVDYHIHTTEKFIRKCIRHFFISISGFIVGGILGYIIGVIL